jgi:hypothetical protein
MMALDAGTFSSVAHIRKIIQRQEGSAFANRIVNAGAGIAPAMTCVGADHARRTNQSRCIEEVAQRMTSRGQAESDDALAKQPCPLSARSAFADKPSIDFDAAPTSERLPGVSLKRSELPSASQTA